MVDVVWVLHLERDFFSHLCHNDDRSGHEPQALVSSE